jgi:hypothetical protein
MDDRLDRFGIRITAVVCGALNVVALLPPLDFVPASVPGFEQRARGNADPLYQELIRKLRAADLVHADETHWREDGRNHFLWYAGNRDVALFHLDAQRSAAAAKVLLGKRLDALLVTDAYAAYNAIEVRARQSCLAHLLRKAAEIRQELELMDAPDPRSLRLCARLIALFTRACAAAIPPGRKARTRLKERYLRLLERICRQPVAAAKAETLRKRLVPGAREYHEAFAFIEHHGPPTNNHAERALRPLVIFRKVCQGTRNAKGSENISIFSSLTQTAQLQGAAPLDLFAALFTNSPASAHRVLFDDSS